MTSTETAIREHVLAVGPTQAAADIRRWLVEALGAASPEGVVLYERGVRRTLCPGTGGVLVYRCPFHDQDIDRWFPSAASCFAALEKMAVANGRTVQGGVFLDLTEPGCQETSARLVSADVYREMYEG